MRLFSAKWKTVDRCVKCGYIYYEYTTMKCPKCGAENYVRMPPLPNMYIGGRKVKSQCISDDRNLEKIMVRKRLFNRWEIKETNNILATKKHVDIKFPQQDENQVLELSKNYLAGTWIVVEVSKKSKTKYKQIKIIESKKVNDSYITTYETDKSPYVEHINIKHTAYDDMLQERLSRLENTYQVANELSNTRSKYLDYDAMIRYGSASVTSTNYTVLKIEAQLHMNDDGTTYKKYYKTIG